MLIVTLCLEYLVSHALSRFVTNCHISTLCLDVCFPRSHFVLICHIVTFCLECLHSFPGCALSHCHNLLGMFAWNIWFPRSHSSSSGICAAGPSVQLTFCPRNFLNVLFLHFLLLILSRNEMRREKWKVKATVVGGLDISPTRQLKFVNGITFAFSSA